MKRVLFTFTVLGFLVAAAFGCAGGEDKTVKLGFVEWDSEIASTNVIKKVLEDEGYNVEITAVDAGVMWTGVAQGEFDGMVAAWLPKTHKNYLKQVKNDIVNLGPNLQGAKIGLVVPDYVNIDSIKKLNDVKDKFEGEIIGIEPGAGVVQATEDAIEEYNLDYSLSTSSSAGMAASLKQAIENNDHIVVTGWTPHWKWIKYDLKYLKDPKKVYGEAEHISTIVRKGLKEDMPEVYKILDNFQWTPDQMGQVMLDIQNGMKPAKAASKWVENHQDQVSKWTNI